MTPARDPRRRAPATRRLTRAPRPAARDACRQAQRSDRRAAIGRRAAWLVPALGGLLSAVGCTPASGAAGGSLLSDAAGLLQDLVRQVLAAWLL